MSKGAFSKPDPYRFNEDYTYPSMEGFRDPAGRVRVDPRLVAGESTLTIITFGQSTSANNVAVGGSYTVTNPTKVHNLNVYDGGIYQAEGVLLGPSGRPGTDITNWQSRMGDKMIDAADVDRVILVPLAVTSTSISYWAPGGSMHARFITAIRRLAAVGLAPDLVYQQIGEGDAVLGTSEAAYEASTKAMVDAGRAEGLVCPWMVAKGTWYSGATYTPVRNACDDLVGYSGIIAGPDADTLSGLTYRNADNTHWNATGMDAMATLARSTIATALGL